jgi:pyruvate/2-oxoglutarate/acetoin dehydrogenase E1 component
MEPANVALELSLIMPLDLEQIPDSLSHGTRAVLESLQQKTLGIIEKFFVTMAQNIDSMNQHPILPNKNA